MYAKTTRLVILAALLNGTTAIGADFANSGNDASGRSGFAAYGHEGQPSSMLLGTATIEATVDREYRTGSAAPAAAGAGACCTECGLVDCACGPLRHCWSVWGEFLYLQPSGVDMVHAQQQNGVGGAGTVPFGRIGAIDPGYEPGFRVGFGRTVDAWSSINASFTHYESEAASVVNPPVIPGGGGAVGSLVHHPQTQLTGSAGPVSGFYEIDYQLVDIDYRSLWGQWHDGWMNYSIGVRYAHLDQQFLQQGTFGGGLGGAIDTSTSINFDGAGLKLGLDGEKIVSSSGISVYGRASAAPMIGQFFSDYRMLNTSTTTELARAIWNDDRFVTMLDYELGLRWTSACGGLQISSGYLAQFWYNAITTPEFVSAVQADHYVDLGDTLSFDGWVTRVELRW